MADIQGTDRLQAQLTALQGLGKVFPRPAAEIVAKRASQIAPRDTGFMAEHITVEEDGEKVFVVSQAPYSVHVEFGTSKMAAQPFMRPALAETERDVLRAAVKALKVEIREKLRR